MGRSPCCDESGLKKGPWTPEEDEKLVKHIQKHGHGSWRALPKLAGLNRCGKSCRLRWTNYLRPDIKRGKFSQDEEQTILNLHSILGNKWSAIATHLPGRTDNEIKNFWNTHLKKKLIQMGFDPMTHRPRTDIFSTLPHLIALANLKELLLDHHHQQQQQHPSQTNNTSLEEQAVLMRSIQASTEMATLQCYLQYLLQPQPQPQQQPSQTTCLPNNMESINLLISSLSSIKDTSNNGSSSSSFSLHDHNNHQAGLLNNLIDSIPFSHLPELSQFPQASKEMINMVQPPADHHHHHDHHYSSLFSTHDQLDNNNYSPNSPNNNNWFASSSSTTPSPPSVLLPRPLAIENTTSSGSSFGGDDHAPSSSAAWPMDLLLEDPFFHEIA